MRPVNLQSYDRGAAALGFEEGKQPDEIDAALAHGQMIVFVTPIVVKVKLADQSA